MLKVTKYDISYFNHYNALRSKHGMPDVSLASIPALGFVSEHDGVPVAYAFIRRVEGGYGQLDGFIVNPDYHGDVRSNALDLVVEYCLLEAKIAGITQVLGLCRNEAPIRRSTKHGFVALSHTVIACDLTKEV